MKRNKLMIVLYGLGAMAAILYTAAAIFPEIFALLTHMEGLGGTTLAMAFVGATADQTVQKVVTTTKDGSVTDGFVHPEMNKPTVSQRLTMIRPSATPLDTILRELDSVSSPSQRFEYFSVFSRGTVQKVSTATVAGADGGMVEVEVQSTHIFSIDGNILVTSFSATDQTAAATAVPAGTISFSPLILHIVGINHATKKLAVCAINAKNVPALPVGTSFFRMGTAKNELDAKSEDPMALPTKDYNLCQIHMTTVAEGVYQALQEKEVKYGLVDIKEQALFDFRMTNEVDSLFGHKRELIDPVSQKPKYMSDGMIRKITKHLDTGSATGITNDVMIGWAADIFSGNNGSDERIMFYGKDFGVNMARLSNVVKQLEAGKTEVKFGLTFNRLETVHGVLLLKLHNIFDLYGYSGASMVIDPANIQRAIQKPLEAEELMLDKSGISRAKTIRLDESHTLAVYNPDTHAMLYAK